MTVGTTGAFFDTVDSDAQAAYVKQLLDGGDVLLVLFDTQQTVKATPAPAAGERTFVTS